MRRALDPVLAIVAGSLGLALAWDVGYGVWSLESLIALAAGLLLAAVLSLASARSALLRRAAVATLFFWGVDIFFVPDAPWVGNLLAAATLLAAVLHRRTGAHFFAAAALVFVAGIGLQPLNRPQVTQDAPRAAASAPTSMIVHLVLDEMGALSAVPPPFRVQADVDEITAAYRQRGFTLRDDWYSASEETVQSLSRLVDTAAGGDNLQQVAGHDRFRIRRNGLHAALAAGGWDVWIRQSSYLDFCVSNRFRCTTYDIANNSYVFSRPGVPLAERADILRREVLTALFRPQRRSSLLETVQDARPDLFRTYAAWSWARPTLPLAMLDFFDTEVRQLATLEGRNYVFLHLLLPHHPWSLARDCSVLPVREWQNPYEGWARRTPEARPAAMRGYWRQQVCAHKRVLAAIDALDAAHPGRVQFLVHGDHGPRLQGRHLRGRLPQRAPQDPAVRDLVNPFVAVRLDSPVNLASAMLLQEGVQALVRQAAAVAPGAASPP